ncbi:hypothetical protein HK099_003455 [Clydaea vesicula]|uniref:Complex 1 LYR protein domain-containing protein n=1 Tax=Clydaea vesicula TaxID=447962 RepID=A0AAD5Y0A5_9FUNG|nr:hypothetical protein HK099_003455 [Clydaea vesicula]KAJ3385843.1 hypothetical protein HDU92_002828 [Lobulomyces angularis]
MQLDVSRSCQIYRKALKIIRYYPLKVHRFKLAYNTREIIEAYKNETDENFLNELFKRGERDLKVLNAFSLLKNDKDLFKLMKELALFNPNSEHKGWLPTFKGNATVMKSRNR